MAAKKIISLEIDETLRQALRAEAFKRELTVSALIRAILEKELLLSNIIQGDSNE